MKIKLKITDEDLRVLGGLAGFGGVVMGSLTFTQLVVVPLLIPLSLPASSFILIYFGTFWALTCSVCVFADTLIKRLKGCSAEKTNGGIAK